MSLLLFYLISLIHQPPTGHNRQYLQVASLLDLIWIDFFKIYLSSKEFCVYVCFPLFIFQTQVATCISITAAADVAGRCILAVISSIVDINTRLLYYIATALTLIVRIGKLFNIKGKISMSSSLMTSPGLTELLVLKIF